MSEFIIFKIKILTEKGRVEKGEARREVGGEGEGEGHHSRTAGGRRRGPPLSHCRWETERATTLPLPVGDGEGHHSPTPGGRRRGPPLSHSQWETERATTLPLPVGDGEGHHSPTPSGRRRGPPLSHSQWETERATTLPLPVGDGEGQGGGTPPTTSYIVCLSVKLIFLLWATVTFNCVEGLFSSSPSCLRVGEWWVVSFHFSLLFLPLVERDLLVGSFHSALYTSHFYALPLPRPRVMRSGFLSPLLPAPSQGKGSSSEILPSPFLPTFGQRRGRAWENLIPSLLLTHGQGPPSG